MAAILPGSEDVSDSGPPGQKCGRGL